ANDDRITNVGQADLEFQHRFHLASFNEITWGATYRNISDQLFHGINQQYDPVDQDLNIYSVFLQDKLTLVEGRLYLTGGAKLENNSYTGDELQPSGRLLWTPDPTNSLWIAVSRAVRIPTQFSETATTYFFGDPANKYGPGTPPVNTYGGVTPDPDILSETLVSSEMGFRTNLTKNSSLDMAAFYNHYENLVSFQAVSGQFPTPNGGVISSAYQAFQAENTGVGNIYGVEISGQWSPLENLKVNFSYTYQDYDQNMINASNIELGAPPPHNLANARIYFDPFKDWELTTAFYYTDA